jgi:iron-sulfur cluster assembly protein|tara:strand:+ start:734 stop:1123 length:390 start_codon:yes stop_codon:yes gene_type:complete
MEKFKPEQLQFSEQAISHFSRMLKKEIAKNSIRIGVRKAGCSGYEYFFGYEEHHNDDDTIIKYEDCTFLVDSKSFKFLKGSKIDYAEDGFNQGIQFHNPNATAVCGCGESFNIDSEKTDSGKSSEVKKK